MPRLLEMVINTPSCVAIMLFHCLLIAFIIEGCRSDWHLVDEVMEKKAMRERERSAEIVENSIIP